MIETNVLAIAYDLRSKYALSRIGKYIKQVLERLEAADLCDIETRKHVLDGFNDLKRDLERTLLVESSTLDK